MRISDWSSDVCSSELLEWRDLGGLGRRLFFQGATALLVFLGEEVRFLWLGFAFEGSQGDFQGLADLFGVYRGKPDAQQQCQVDQCRQEQGKTETISRAHAAMGELLGQIGRESHGKETNIAFFSGRA